MPSTQAVNLKNTVERCEKVDSNNKFSITFLQKTSNTHSQKENFFKNL